MDLCVFRLPKKRRKEWQFVAKKTEIPCSIFLTSEFRLRWLLELCSPPPTGHALSQTTPQSFLHGTSMRTSQSLSVWCTSLWGVFWRRIILTNMSGEALACCSSDMKQNNEKCLVFSFYRRRLINTVVAKAHKNWWFTSYCFIIAKGHEPLLQNWDRWHRWVLWS